MKKFLATAAAASLLASAGFAGTAPTAYEKPVQNDDAFVAVPETKKDMLPILLIGLGGAAIIGLASGGGDDNSTGTTTGQD